MFNRDPLPTIVERTKADVVSRLGSDELLRRSDALVLARVLAGMAHEMYGYIDWAARQILFDTSDEDILQRQASIWKTPQKAAEFATGVAVATGVDGRVIGEGVIAKRPDGTEFEVQSEATISGSSVEVSFKASLAGAAGNTPAGTILTLLNPIDGVQSQLTVKEPGFTNGSDIEPVSTFRARFIRRVGRPGSGGALFDYETWALEVPGVTRAWATAGEMGPGTVTLRFVRDDDASMIPDEPEVEVVRQYLLAKRAATAILYVVAPIADPVTFQIQLTPASVAVKAAVEAELRDLVRREALPSGTLLLSHIEEAISTAAGEVDHVLVSPNANVTSPVGHIATFGEIEWL